jgi:hypothetical protein
MKTLMNLFTGDIILTRSNTLLGKAIRFAERRPGDKSWANHVGLVTHSGSTQELAPYQAEMTEALWRVRRGDVRTHYGEPAGAGRPDVKIWRPKAGYVSSAQRSIAAAHAEQYVGAKYGWWKLLAHAGDALLAAALPVQNVRLFRRLLFMDERPICSFLVAVSYATAGVTFGVDADTASPDDIDDYCTKSEQWECIFQGKL